MTSFSETPALVVGFEGENLAELRRVFDVSCVIATDPSADINWYELHDHRLPHEPPSFDSEMQACLSSVSAHYLPFTDINSRRFYYVPGREAETYNGFMLTFYAVYKLLKSRNIGLVLYSNIAHEGFDFVLFLVARFLGIRNVMCHQSLVPNRFWLTESPLDLGLFQQNPILFAKEPSNYALPETWFYMRGSDADAAYGLSDVLREVLRRPQRLPPALVRYAYARQYRAGVAEQTRHQMSQERYIYFPLHLQPELTTSALGGTFADQLLAIEALSAWLPAGVMIILKENPKQTEKQRGPLFYKRLKALANVRLLARHENSIDLIKNSIGVATITGTAGWEALFHGKPVMTFGAAWYRSFPGVHAFSSALDFQTFVAGAAVERSQLVDILDQALQTAGKGLVNLEYAQLVSDFDPSINAQHVADSIMRYLHGPLNAKPSSVT